MLCLIPAIHYGALFGSMLLRPAVLTYASWATRHAPAEEDAGFPSWEPLRATREVARRLAALWRAPALAGLGAAL